MAEEVDRWERLIRGLRDGDQGVAFEFWEQYGDALHRLADRNLAPGLRRRIGPEDVVQSACRTFLRRAQGGEFQLDDSEGLWRVLCAITLTKIREQARFHLRQKRGLNQEQHMPPAPTDSASGGFDPADPNPTPAEAIAFTDYFSELLSSLDEEERQVVELKLQDLTNEQVAEKLGCSERTVRRVVKRVQSHMAASLSASFPIRGESQ
jgi:RNA polymerase sigma factor (sigma-70 family)